MRWRTVKFSELFRVKHGYPFDSEHFATAGAFVLLTPGSFHESGGYRERGEKTKYYTGDVPDGYVLDEGELLVAMTEQAPGLLGSSAWIPEGNRFLHNQRLGRIVDLDEQQLDKRFLYYLFNTPLVRAQIAGSASGTKVRHTAPERIGRVQVQIPPIEVQRWIAATLTAYDDAMENNRRRMGLLEKAARLLYEEWFVRLRFPGHEHTPVRNGLPQGWVRVALEEALVLQRGFDLPKEQWEAGDFPICGSTGIIGYHVEAKVKGPGVVTGRSGTLGVVSYVNEDYWPHNTSLWVKAFKKVTPLFALFLLRGMNLKQYNGGASVPTLDRKAVHRVEVVIPPKHLVEAFDRHLVPMFDQIKNLALQNQKLRAARDLLLPRLMSGEIEV